MASGVDTAVAILKDPALPTLLKQITILRDLELADQAPETPGHPNTNVPDTGLGLHRVVRAIDAYIWFRRNRWIAAVAVGGIIFVPGVLGFVLGRASASAGAKSAKLALKGAALKQRCVKRRASTSECLEWDDDYRPKARR